PRRLAGPGPSRSGPSISNGATTSRTTIPKAPGCARDRWTVANHAGMNASTEAERYRGSKWIVVQCRPDGAHPGDTPWRPLDNAGPTILDLAASRDSRNNAINSRIARKSAGPPAQRRARKCVSDIRPGPADSDSEVAPRTRPRRQSLGSRQMLVCRVQFDAPYRRPQPSRPL